MPSYARRHQLERSLMYHVFNRSNARQMIFRESEDFGYFKQLIKEYIKWAKDKKIKRIRVIASAMNSNAIAIYKKTDFSDYNLVLEREI